MRLISQELSQRRGRQDTFPPELDVLGGCSRDALLDLVIHLRSEPSPQLTQEHRAFTLLDAFSFTSLETFLEPFLDRRSSPGLVDILGGHEKLLIIAGLFCCVRR